MKTFVLLHTSLITIPHSLTFADILQHVLLITPFTRANYDPFLLFKSVSEWTCNLNQNVLIHKCLIFQSHIWSNKWLQTLTRTCHSCVLLNLVVWLSTHHCVQFHWCWNLFKTFHYILITRTLPQSHLVWFINNSTQLSRTICYTLF